jgi:assimilatory nitrate reductase catalytic subunit
MMQTAIRSTCPYCGVGCGVKAVAGAQTSVVGDEQHPANRGRLCVKGAALGETLDLEGRLLHPQLRRDGQLHEASWDQALDTVAGGFARIIAEHGADAVALYVSGQLLTEDYYVANKLMKGYIGSANIDTNSRLCMSSSVAGHKRAFGEDIVPGCYDDLDQADLVVLAGSNAAWCHPILYQRLVAAKAARPAMRIVVIDPRRTATCEIADLHLPIKPGTDVWLFNGLLTHLNAHSFDAAFVGDHTSGLAAALDAAALSPAQVAAACSLDIRAVETFYRDFAGTDKVVTAYSQGVNQSSSGTDKVNAIINCHLITGRIGKPGMGPFSLTGQPNAMGGREVGGMANMLAAHMELDRPDHRAIVQDFWGSPRIADKPGLKAVDLFRDIGSGKVKAVWIIATNPVVSLPDADGVKRALERCELVVVSDIAASTDMHPFADVLLPALGWGEKDGTVTNSERMISRQRAFLPAPGQARADWWMLCEVARKMGFGGFEFDSAAAIFQEHARLSLADNAGTTTRLFNLAGLEQLDANAYDALQPVQWPLRRQRLFGDGVFAHADGRARFIATVPRAPAHAVDDDFPLVLNTGRVRDQWHTMSRTGKAARLSTHTAESFIDMHPQDALLAGVREGDLARVSSRWGAMVARVRHGGGIARGGVFIPIHWNGQTASDARVGAVCNPAVDPVSGEPEFKHTPVTVTPFGIDWHGFVLTRGEPGLDGVAHWTRVRGAAFHRFELAGRGAIADLANWARAMLGVLDREADWIDYEDKAGRVYRGVHLADGRIEACVFVAPTRELPAREWLGSLFAAGELSSQQRAALLSGQAPGAGPDAGATVCSCFGVGENTICAAIKAQGLTSVAQVTACVKAGGNCGSCVPEIRQLLARSLALDA